MADTVFLHVGTPKAGTTYLQTVLWHNRDRLRAAGLLVPGERLYDHNMAAQGLRAKRAVKRRPKSAAMWRQFVDDMRAWPGHAVVTNEWFTLSTPQEAARAIAAFAPAEVHVVVTARDLTALVPAAWQESLKVGHPLSMTDFIAALDDGDERWTWASLDPARVLETWAETLPPERAHVITVPPHGTAPGRLWQRLAGLLGLDPAAYDTASIPSNESLGAEAAALLQRVGPGLRVVLAAEPDEASRPSGTEWVEPYRWIRNYVSHELLVPRGGSRISLRPSEHDAIQARSAQSARALAAAGYDIVGDLSELCEGAPDPGARHPDDVSADEMLAVAGPLLADLLVRVRAETERDRKG